MTDEEYGHWSCAEVQAGIDEADRGETLSHARAVAEMRAHIAKRRADRERERAEMTDREMLTLAWSRQQTRCEDRVPTR